MRDMLDIFTELQCRTNITGVLEEYTYYEMFIQLMDKAIEDNIPTDIGVLTSLGFMARTVVNMTEKAIDECLEVLIELYSEYHE